MSSAGAEQAGKRRGSDPGDHSNHALRFSAGNPRVEHVVGNVYLHTQHTAAQGGPMESATSATSATSGSSTRVCIMGLPPKMGFSELCTYLGASYEHVNEIRLVRREIGDEEAADDAGGHGDEDGSATYKNNTLLVLLSFDNLSSAESFYGEFHDRPFCLLDPEFVCRLMFVRDVEVLDGCCAPCEPSADHASRELPSCPVCLERLEPSASGIVTTVCNHQFHSQCLRQWVDSSCPVCRYVQGGDCGVGRSAAPSPSLECVHEACRSTVDLWMCLICGHTGCGRYRGSHAAEHFEETGHGFALEVADGRGVRSGRQGSELVWDYTRDAYVHRLVSEDPVGGFRGASEGFEDTGVRDESCELEKAPVACVGGDREVKTGARAVDAALVQAKVDSVATELTQLLVSQMEMQRAYYEKIVDSHHRATERALEDTNAAAAVALAASAAADGAAQKAEQATRVVQRKNRELSEKLERSRKEQSFLRELNETLLSDTRGWRDRVKSAETERDALKAEVSELQDQVKDLMMFIEARDAIEKGGLAAEAQGGTASIGPRKKR